MHSASFCQIQENRQREIARIAALQNSRTIASIAADAWAKEGREAVKREARKQGQLDPEDAAIAADFLSESDDKIEETEI